MGLSQLRNQPTSRHQAFHEVSIHPLRGTSHSGPARGQMALIALVPALCPPSSVHLKVPDIWGQKRITGRRREGNKQTRRHQQAPRKTVWSARPRTRLTWSCPRCRPRSSSAPGPNVPAPGRGLPFTSVFSAVTAAPRRGEGAVAPGPPRAHKLSFLLSYTPRNYRSLPVGGSWYRCLEPFGVS